MFGISKLRLSHSNKTHDGVIFELFQPKVELALIWRLPYPVEGIPRLMPSASAFFSKAIVRI